MSLVELMVAMAIGLFLLAGMTTLFVEQSSTRRELDKASKQVENGRYAVQLLKEDIEHAGFYGEYYTAGAAPGALPDPCATDLPTLETGMSLPVQGYDAPMASPLTCLDAANHKPGTDILVVRRAETSVSTTTVAGQVYLQTTAARYVLGTSASTLPAGGFTLMKKDGVTSADRRRFLVHIYYVSPCNVPTAGTTCSAGNTDDGGRSIPTLKRMELSVIGGTTTLVTTPLVEGIENLQLDYGIDANGDGTPDDAGFVTNPALAQWQNVTAVNVNLLARNNEETNGYQETKSYPLGAVGLAGPCAVNAHPDATSCPKFKRHAYSALVRVVNPSSRRETP